MQTFDLLTSLKKDEYMTDRNHMQGSENCDRITNQTRTLCADSAEDSDYTI